MKRYTEDFKIKAVKLYNECNNYNEVSRQLGVSDESVRIWCNSDLRKRIKEYCSENKTERNEYNKKYYKKNKERENKRTKKYFSENRKSVNAQRRKYHTKRYKEDINYRLKFSLRNRIRDVLHAQKAYKNKTSEELIGCSIEKFKIHIEHLFKDGMTWDNYGKKGWVLDHIIPCSSFDLTNPEKQKECFNYKNIQPLWEWENIEKSDKLLC